MFGMLLEVECHCSLAPGGAPALIRIKRGAGARRKLARMRLIIAGAAGRDFHNFNVVYRDHPAHEVVAFTAAQIPGIAGRRYPASLAGPWYPDGIPIVPESELEAMIREQGVEAVVLAYSDLAHEEAMHLASRVLACGADFLLLGPERTMLDARLPVIAVSAARTGAGKSPLARWLSRRLRDRGLRVAVVRHPMPYGELEGGAVRRYAAAADLAGCTIEEREEYEPHLASGNVVFAGVDYASVQERASREADLILWDGGNNDFPFLRPGLHIVLADALRPGQETAFHPGEACLRMADVIVVTKCDSAAPDSVARVVANCRAVNPRAPVLRSAMPFRLDNAGMLRQKRVLVVEDGPTITHGGMPHGAGLLAAQRAGAIVLDPKPFASGPVAAVYRKYPHIGPVLPAIGYRAAEIEALRRTIEASGAEIAVCATPADLGTLSMPVARVRYEFEERDSPGLWPQVGRFLDARGL
jgi:predicted GTPase